MTEPISKQDYRVHHLYDDKPPFRIPHVVIKCPNCKAKIGLRDRLISDGGKVSEAVQCPYCDFEDSIKLEDWNYVAQKKESK